MRRLMVILFVIVVVVLMAAGVAGARSESASDRYAQVVDDALEGRFQADESWGESTYGEDVYGDEYRYADPVEDGTPAWFKVELPETAKYAVYARWPDADDLNASVPVGVETTSGLEWKTVDQSQDGGRWVRVGVFEMEEGDDYFVRISPETDGEGYVAADAVKVVQVSEGESSSEETAESNTPRKSSAKDATRKRSERDARSEKRSEKDSSGTDAAASPEGAAVVKEARKWIGTRYRTGGASRSGVDCSGLTMMVLRKSGVKLPHWDEKQYRYGAKVTGSLRPGDLVFFDEHNRGISHVGIYSGNGKLIHASDHFNKVVESEMQYIKGFKGARRLV